MSIKHDISDPVGDEVTASGGAEVIASADAVKRASGPGPYVMLASTLEGNKVINPDGENIGTISGIMLDVEQGRIAYAVLSVGGFLGIGDKLFAVPWGALQLQADERCFILDVDKDSLRNAPGFDKDDWPSVPDRALAVKVHSYFNIPFYWES